MRVDLTKYETWDCETLLVFQNETLLNYVISEEMDGNDEGSGLDVIKLTLNFASPTNLGCSQHKITFFKQKECDRFINTELSEFGMEK